MSSPLSETPEGVRVAVRAIPRAGTNALAGVREGRLVVKVTAAPEDGKANAAIVKLLSKAWRIPARRIELVSGAAAREKLLLLRGLTLADLPDDAAG
jgi:uncharacterized protein (TIGR00251 family)